MLTEQEKKLLRQQAEAYAFILDLRKLAISRGDKPYILMTHGVEATIDKRKEEYPRIFQRFFQAALQRAEKHKNGTEKQTPEKQAQETTVVFTTKGKAEKGKK